MNLRGDEAMDVHVLLEGAVQRLIAGDVREDAQFDLRVVGHEQQEAGFGRHERLADAFAQLSADRDVLQVRVAAAEAAGGGGGLVERSVQLARRRQNHLRQRVHVGGFQLAELTEFQDQSRQPMADSQLRKDVAVRRSAGLGPSALRQAQLVEQDRGKLLGGGDVELLAGLGVDLLLERRDLRRKPFRHLPQHVGVEANPVALHLNQHGNQRKLDPREQVQHLLFAKLLIEEFGQSERNVRVRAGVFANLLHRNAVHRGLLLAAADQVADRDHPVVEEVGRKEVQRVASALRVQHVGGDHRVEDDPAQLDTLVEEHDGVVLEILADLADGFVREDGAQRGEDLFLVQHFLALGRTDRQVPCLLLLPGEGQADELRGHRRGAGRLQIEGEATLSAQPFQKIAEQGLSIDEMVRYLLSCRLRGELGKKLSESQPFVNRRQSVWVGRFDPAFFEVELDRNVGVDGHQSLAEPRLLGVVLEVLLQLRARHLGRMRQNFLERAVLPDQFQRGFWTHLRHAGNVVGSVSRETHYLHDLGRLDSAAFSKRLVGNHDLLSRVENPDARAEKLLGVLVAGHEEDLNPLLGHLARDRAEHVVGLISFLLEDGNLQGVENVMGHGNL